MLSTIYRSVLKIKHVRYSSRLASEIQVYLKDRGNFIPFANLLLSAEEYDKYSTFRKIKLGKYNSLNKFASTHSLKENERKTYINYINDLKKQPYSVYNFVVGYWIFQFGLNLGFFSLRKANHVFKSLFGSDKLSEKIDHLKLDENIEPMMNIFDIVTFSPDAKITLLLGCSAVLCSGLVFAKQGIKIMIDEFKSPYYNYDEMLRIFQGNKIILK